MNSNSFQQYLFNWLMRRTTNSSIRRVADLPIAIATDIGLVRTENQDRVAVFRIPQTEGVPSVVAVLCDGMGGMTDGAICASLAISTFLSAFVQNTNGTLQNRLISSVIQANNIIFEKYNGKGGSTLSAFVMDYKEGVLGINIGDSRIYALENNKLFQITVDDTLAGQFAHDKEYTFGRNELLQYIGMGQGIEPHIISLSEYSQLPTIVLTSDGVHFLDNRTMELVTNHASDSALAARRLVELAKWCGGHDNASVIILNLSKMVLEKTSFNLGELEIWDASGELKLIFSENSNPNIQNKEEPETNINKKAKSAKESHKKPRKPKQPRLIDDTSAPVVMETKEKGTESKKIPQLQIDFNN